MHWPCVWSEHGILATTALPTTALRLAQMHAQAWLHRKVGGTGWAGQIRAAGRVLSLQTESLLEEHPVFYYLFAVLTVLQAGSPTFAGGGAP